MGKRLMIPSSVTPKKIDCTVVDKVWLAVPLEGRSFDIVNQQSVPALAIETNQLLALEEIIPENAPAIYGMPTAFFAQGPDNRPIPGVMNVRLGSGMSEITVNTKVTLLYEDLKRIEQGSQRSEFPDPKLLALEGEGFSPYTFTGKKHTKGNYWY